MIICHYLANTKATIMAIINNNIERRHHQLITPYCQSQASVNATSSSSSSSSSLSSSSWPYLIDHLRSMREQESHYTVRADYLSSPDATNVVIMPQDRRDICSWSYKVTDKCLIDRSVAFIGMSYLDRFMCTSSPGAKAALLSRKEYQLAAVACLAIALKSRSGIRVGTDFVSRYVCQGLYDARELERLEVEILGALTWRLNGPSPHDFVDAIVGLIPTYCSDGATSFLVFTAKAYVEAAVLDHLMAMQPRSSLAYAALQ